MNERRVRGRSPAGRGDRRSSRSVRTRSGADASGRMRAARGGGSRPVSPAEPTFFGMSTGKAVILAMVMCGLAMTLAVPIRTYFSQRAEAREVTAQHRDLENDVQQLRQRRAQQQDPAYIRTEARERLRLVLPGETPYIVQVPGMTVPAPTDPAAQAAQSGPWYSSLWATLDEPPRPAAP